MTANLCSVAARFLPLLVAIGLSATLRAEVATFSLDEVVRPPFNPVCPQSVIFHNQDATLRLANGGLVTGNTQHGNPSTIYIGDNSVGCGGSIQMFFSPPATNPSFTLGVPSYWRDRFRVTASIAFSEEAPSQFVELRGTSQVVTMPFSNVSHITVRPLEQLGLFGWFYSVDNIRFEYQPAAEWDTFDFDLAPGTLEEARRVLIHKYRSDDQYPSVWQQQDGEIRIVGTAMKTGGGAVAGARVYFRVVDPPDSAPYVPAADRRDGDNQGDPGTLLGGTSAVADASGRATTTLRITDRYAGDNYQIEASPDPQFSCAPNCSKSGILTAWKRVYVEQNRMFRRGTLLLENITPGQMEIVVRDHRVFPRAPFRVKLVHAPPVLGIGGDFYEELVDVTGLQRMPTPDVPNAARLVTAAPILSFYFSADTAQNARKQYLADGVGLWTGTQADHFSANLSSVASTFEDAFVEYVFLQEPIAGMDGSVPRVEFGTLQQGDNALMQRDLYAFKWGRSNSRPGGMVFAQPNHQVLYIANTSDPQRTIRGVVVVLDGSNDAWLFMASLSAAQSREAAVHELAHQWRVNHGEPWHSLDSQGHCNTATRPSIDRFIYNRPADGCTMTSTDTVSTDGIIGFHYVMIGGQPDSEYLRIRYRVDPVPQDEVNRFERAKP